MKLQLPHTTLQHTAAHCSTLQHTAAHCSTLQHHTLHMRAPAHHVMPDKTRPDNTIPLHCVALHNVAAHGGEKCTDASGDTVEGLVYRSARRIVGRNCFFPCSYRCVSCRRYPRKGQHRRARRYPAADIRPRLKTSGYRCVGGGGVVSVARICGP